MKTLKSNFFLLLLINLFLITGCVNNSGFVADKKELAWLKSNCVKLATSEPKTGFQDLQFLKDEIGNSRIVGLGEFSHGSSEVFKMKHRLVEFLVSEMGFNIFSIEENMPETFLINDYVVKGKGNPEELLQNGSQIWNNKEILDLLQWMQKYNTNEKTKIQYFGFDMQNIMPAYLNLSLFAEQHDKTLKNKIDSLRIIIENGQTQTG